MLEAGSGRAQEPMTYQLTNLDKNKTYRIRVSARMDRGIPSPRMSWSWRLRAPGLSNLALFLLISNI